MWSNLTLILFDSCGRAVAIEFFIANLTPDCQGSSAGFYFWLIKSGNTLCHTLLFSYLWLSWPFQACFLTFGSLHFRIIINCFGWLIYTRIWLFSKLSFECIFNQLWIIFATIFYVLFLMCKHLSWFCRVNIVFIDKEGSRHPVRGKIGDNVLYLAHKFDIELEGWSHQQS